MTKGNISLLLNEWIQVFVYSPIFSIFLNEYDLIVTRINAVMRYGDFEYKVLGTLLFWCKRSMGIM